MHFEKHDMVGKHYSWNSDSKKQLFIGQPSRRLFDRFNGEQVLFIINSYGSQSDRFTLEEGRMIEYEISNHLPDELKSELSVFNWINKASFKEA